MRNERRNTDRNKSQVFVRQEIRHDEDIQANVVNNTAIWFKVHQHVPASMKRSHIMDERNSQSPMARHADKHSQEFVSDLHDKLRSFSSKYSIDTTNSIFDMNELPYISQMRSLFLIVCGMSFLVSPFAYMPLGTIQASFNQKCFLFTRPKFNFITKKRNNSNQHYKTITFDSIETEWGPTSYCEFTTFTPVSVAIFNTIIGWSTFTIWPLMMSLGKGGVLMLMYAFISIVSLVAEAVSNLCVRDGYLETCKAIRTDYAEASVTCADLNNRDIAVSEVSESRLTEDVHRAMMVAETAGWCMTGLALLQVLICSGTFGIIWFHFHINPFDVFEDMESDGDEYEEYDDDLLQ